MNILLAHYNTTGDTWATGDLNYDGKTNALDLNILLARYNTSLPPGVSGVTLFPEPGTLVLLAAGVFGLLAYAGASGSRRGDKMKCVGAAGVLPAAPNFFLRALSPHRHGDVFQPEPLHLLVERGAVDAQRLGRDVAVPVVGFEHLADDLPLGALQRLLERAAGDRIRG